MKPSPLNLLRGLPARSGPLAVGIALIVSGETNRSCGSFKTFRTLRQTRGAAKNTGNLFKFKRLVFGLADGKHRTLVRNGPNQRLATSLLSVLPCRLSCRRSTHHSPDSLATGDRLFAKFTLWRTFVRKLASGEAAFQSLFMTGWGTPMNGVSLFLATLCQVQFA